MLHFIRLTVSGLYVTPKVQVHTFTMVWYLDATSIDLPSTSSSWRKLLLTKFELRIYLAREKFLAFTDCPS